MRYVNDNEPIKRRDIEPLMNVVEKLKTLGKKSIGSKNSKSGRGEGPRF
jgi:hypothetical protein